MKFGDVLYQSRDRVAFKQRAEEVGFKQAVVERDSADPIAGSKN